LVGIDGSEDATVYRLSDTMGLVQTVDLITPVVDDPYFFGQVAAANSLSDVFAMGGRVVTAMNIVGFDACHHDADVLAEMLAGGQSKVEECGGVIAGGHTIETPEMLYGMSVSGVIDPHRVYRNNTPQAGDTLILTKPLGMGIVTTAIKADMIEISRIPDIVTILSQLNWQASQIMQDFSVHACTDVTGFGLAGHAREMGAEAYTMAFEYGTLPIVPEAIEMAQMGIIPAGSYNNLEFLESKTQWKSPVEDRILFYDAQTSGGLLIAVAPAEAHALQTRLIDAGYPHTAIVGEVLPYDGVDLRVV